MDFQDGICGSHLFPVGMILAFFDLQTSSMILTKFQVNWSFGSGEDAKIDFQDGHHGIRTILAIFDLLVASMLPPSFESIGLSVQEKKR